MPEAPPIDSKLAGTAIDEVAVPVIQEELQVGTRWVDAGGVRLRKLVHADAVTVDVPLLVESVGVQRVPIGRDVEGPVGVRWEGDVMIVPVLEERLVFRKQLVLVEELHLIRTSQTRHAPQEVITCREEVIVERIEAGLAAVAGEMANHAAGAK